ncbi:MAG: Hpt domain-containing protein [Candidatus Electrothrix sp. MAN1_4]|nr:Hpt domain-containing protein [Candidatus Electrothrix sp. MAN1_4]
MPGKLPLSLPCLDIQAGIRQLEGNQDLYIKLLKKFAECNQDLAENIAERLQHNDKKKAQILAHSTKGVAGSIGATELYMASATLETALMQGNAENTLQDFTVLLKTVLQSIHALLHDQEQNDPIPRMAKDLDVEHLFHLLDELDMHLRAGDFNALQSYVSLQEYVGDTEVAEEVNTWEDPINLFDYTRIAEQLAMLRIKLRSRTF